MFDDFKRKDSVTKSIYWGILFISILGSIMHFVYDLSGKMLVVGFFAPVNESVWEHLKLPFLPTILWWTISYFMLSKDNKINLPKWFYSASTSLIICPLFIVSFHYTYSGAFGIESLILDISSLFIGIIIAQFFALHLYQYSKIKIYHYLIAILILLILIISFIAFTVNPPSIPLFR